MAHMQPQPRSVELGRKEMDRLPNNPKIRESIIAAAMHTETFAAGAGFSGSLKTQISLCGKTIGSLLSESDEPILFVPAYIVHNDKDQQGCVLTLPNRAILGWTEGTFKLRYFARSIPYGSIRRAEFVSGPPQYLKSIRLQADDVWTLHLRPIFGAGQVGAGSAIDLPATLLTTFNSNNADAS